MEISSMLKDRDSSGGGSPLPLPRSDPNHPYPTTFVTADSSSFKHVVQMLTGSPETSKNLHHQHSKPTHNHHVIPPIRSPPKKPGFKLYERRNLLKNSLLSISPLGVQNAAFSPRNIPPEILSPSLLDFPALTLSPVTPLVEEDPFDKSSSSPSTVVGNSPAAAVEVEEEERAIAEKGFYLHPSPLSTPRESEPQLLPLFPVTSPRVESESSRSS